MFRRTLTAALALLAITLTTPALAVDYDRAKELYQTEKYRLALAHFRSLARDGDKRAQYYLGNMFALGQGVKQDHEEAAKWYERSAKSGSHRSAEALGKMYLAGLGVEMDEARGKLWLEMAADLREENVDDCE